MVGARAVGSRARCLVLLAAIVGLLVAIHFVIVLLPLRTSRCASGDGSTAGAPSLSRKAIPQCLRAWAERDRAQVQAQLVDRGFTLRLPPPPQQKEASCQKRAAVYIASYRSLLRYLHHMPHFCEVYFNFYSLLIWQDMVLEERCIHSFIVDDSISSYWQKSPYDADAEWMGDLVKIVDRQWSTKSVISDSCPWLQAPVAPAANANANASGRATANVVRGALHGWFLHPVDAVMLQAAVLGEDPCDPTNRAALTDPSVAVLVLSRKSNRRLMHAEILAEFLRAKPSVKAVSVVAFGGGPGSLQHQARLLHGASVLIATHGAGNTNMAFMRPCSVIIELFPALFFIPGYFGSLAQRAGLLHFPMQAAANASHFLTPLRRECKQAFLRAGQSQGDASAECFQDAVCRRCARSVDLIEIDFERLGLLLDKALEARSRCLADSLYYSNLL